MIQNDNNCCFITKFIHQHNTNDILNKTESVSDVRISKLYILVECKSSIIIQATLCAMRSQHVVITCAWVSLLNAYNRKFELFFNYIDYMNEYYRQRQTASHKEKILLLMLTSYKQDCLTTKRYCLHSLKGMSPLSTNS